MNNDGKCPEGYEYVGMYTHRDGSVVKAHCKKLPIETYEKKQSKLKKWFFTPKNLIYNDNTEQEFRETKQDQSAHAKQVVIEAITKNAPEYLGFVSDVDFKPMKHRAKVKNGTIERARIRGNIIYFDPELVVDDAKFKHVLLHEVSHKIDQEENGMRNQGHNKEFFEILQSLSGEEVLSKYKENGVFKHVHK